MKYKLRDIIFFGGMTLLVIVAVSYSFSLIPSPFQQQTRQTDRQRASDITALSEKIDAFAKQYGKLPTSIAEAAPTADVAKLDPQTQTPYEYIKVDQYSYNLCATFSTDTQNKNANTDYSLTDTTNDVKHPAGRYCFPYKPLSTTPSFNLDPNTFNQLQNAASQYLPQILNALPSNTTK